LIIKLQAKKCLCEEDIITLKVFNVVLFRQRRHGCAGTERKRIERMAEIATSLAVVLFPNQRRLDPIAAKYICAAEAGEPLDTALLSSTT
jgi:hypothetical protein